MFCFSAVFAGTDFNVEFDEYLKVLYLSFWRGIQKFVFKNVGKYTVEKAVNNKRKTLIFLPLHLHLRSFLARQFKVV